MKRKILFILLYCCFSYAQNKENVYFLYLGKITDIKINSIVKIENQHFKIVESDFKLIDYKKIKSKIISFDNFIIKNKNKKFPDYYNIYNIYIYIPINKSKGNYIRAEKIWIIDEPIE